jgi:protoporphyrinogen oxidase
MRIGIIGAGFTGLAAAYSLVKKGHQVVVYEKEQGPGGLAIGFKSANWLWPLEKHYHHLFVSDSAIIDLAGEVNHRIVFKRPQTSVFVDGRIYQLDSPISLLSFDKLSFLSRIRTGLVLAYLRFTHFWKPLEKVSARDFLMLTMGRQSWRILWEALFIKKFGRFADAVPASWFWARIKKRSASLGYPDGGFESLARSVEKKIIKSGGEFIYQSPVETISRRNKKIILKVGGKPRAFDRVICTLPTPFFIKIAKGLSRNYIKGYSRLSGLGAVNLVLVLKHKFLSGGTYWLNINEAKFPFLGIMEQTNFVSKSRYKGETIVYIGNYLEPSHPYFSASADSLLKKFTPFLKRINPKFSRIWVKKALVFKAPFAQPIITRDYSKKIPPLKTPIKGLYLANIQQVYPWDRGTNYAVELGQKVAHLIG